MAKNKPNPEPEEKQYGLKDIELRVVANINQRANAEMLDFLSFVAIERLAVNVTENTTFRVDDGKLWIAELEPQETPEAPAEEGVVVA